MGTQGKESDVTQQGAKIKAVFTIQERDGAKSIWTRVGTGFVNRDDSINIILHSLPINGKLHVRDPHEGSSERKAG
jgi:hypothetical protein